MCSLSFLPGKHSSYSLLVPLTSAVLRSSPCRRRTDISNTRNTAKLARSEDFGAGKRWRAPSRDAAVGSSIRRCVGGPDTPLSEGWP